jgi:2,3-bisphosphoglycerate-dependent phosphoglycerate mutase
MVTKLAIIRHGLTEWSGKFTGWTDIDIIEQGIKDTRKYAQRINEAGIKFDVAYTSYLKRAIRTLWTALDTLNQMYIPVIKSWKLNERHYGDLQGKSKPEMVEKYGAEQVNVWRHSYSAPPPLMEKSNPSHPIHDEKYKNVDPSLLPSGEALANTYARSVPYFQENIEEALKSGKNVILSGHHNSLRSIIKYLNNLSEEEVTKLNVPYCIPLVYEFNSEAKVLKHYYLAPDSEVEEVINSIKNQTKK